MKRCNMASFFLLLPFLTILAIASSFPEHQNASVVAVVSNRLAVGLHKKFSAEDDNVFFSPLSISTAVAMLFRGTRGKTAEEMRHALGYQQAGLTDSQVHSAFQSIVGKLSEDSVDSTSMQYLLYLANAVLIQEGYPVLDEYITDLQKIYKATVRNVDFEKQRKKAVQEINDWVKQKTNNQICKLLDDVDPDTVLILLSAVYFKGAWKTKFEQTMDGTFFNKGLEIVKTRMMRLKKKVLYTRLENAQAIELPYKGEDISMIIVLPDALDGLPKLEQELTPNTLKEIRRSTRSTTAVVILPKFKIEYEKNLNAPLRYLGVKNCFERSANLSGISQARNLAVSEIIHKAKVEVNEDGTEAAAVTGVVMKAMSAFLHEIHFVADHPFLFTIVDKNDLMLFLGSVNRL